MSEWSLEGELRSAAQAPDVHTALRELGVLTLEEEIEDIVPLGDWQRGGAETYIYRFDVLALPPRTIRLILKALVPHPAAETVGAAIRSRVQRRALLAGEGVKVPRLYFAGHGSMLEEFIPHNLVECFKRWEWESSDHRRFGVDLLVELYIYANALDRLGFAPIAPFVDLRTDGRSVFVIDYGQDLGPAFVATVRNAACWESVRDFLRRALPSVPDGAIEEAEVLARARVPALW